MNGPCAKQRVVCTIVHPDGHQWTGENECRNPQPSCPRAGMATGQGYELCRDVCQQVGHAEVVAVAAAGGHAKGATAYIEGHTYVCENCEEVLQSAGVSYLVIGPPPTTS